MLRRERRTRVGLVRQRDAGHDEHAAWSEPRYEVRGDLLQHGRDDIRDDDVESSGHVGRAPETDGDGDTVAFGVVARGVDGEPVGVDRDDRRRAALRRRDGEDARSGTDIEKALAIECDRGERLETLLRRRMETGAEGHAGIEHDGDRIAARHLDPRRSYEEPSYPKRRELGLPRLEPVFLLDLARDELADRTETEGLQVPERVLRVVHLGDAFGIHRHVRLHDVIRAAARLDGKLDRDALMTDAREDLAHRFHRFRVRGHRDLEPAELWGAHSPPMASLIRSNTPRASSVCSGVPSISWSRL